MNEKLQLGFLEGGRSGYPDMQQEDYSFEVTRKFGSVLQEVGETCEANWLLIKSISGLLESLHNILRDFPELPDDGKVV